MNNPLRALERRLYAAKKACFARDRFAAARFALHHAAAVSLLTLMSPADRKAARDMYDVVVRKGQIVFI